MQKRTESGFVLAYGLIIDKPTRNTKMFAQFATIVSAAFYDLAIQASTFVEQVQYTLAV